MKLAFDLENGNDSLHSFSGISLVGQVLKNTKLDNLFERFHKPNCIFQDTDILKSLIGSLSQGRDKFADISQFRNNVFFNRAMNVHAVPSEERLRQRLELMPKKHNELLQKANLNLLRNWNFQSESKGDISYIPLDVDVSVLDNSNSKKELVSCTYKMHDGYAPMFAYLGQEGFMLTNELRPGEQHAQKGMPQFLDNLFIKVDQLELKHPVLLRLDSAHDAEINFAHFPEKHFYIIKRNLRRECREQWLALARRVGRKVECSEARNVFLTEVHHKSPGNKEKASPVPMVLKVTEIFVDKKGDKLLFPQIKVDSFWTNLPLEAEDVIELYHNHGTSEQFHSELKSDMNVERLPSGKFSSNQLYLNCAMIAFNSLRFIGQIVIKNKGLAPVKIKGNRRRLKSVIRDIILLACKHVKRSRRNILKFGRDSPWFDIFSIIAMSLT